MIFLPIHPQHKQIANRLSGTRHLDPNFKSQQEPTQCNLKQSPTGMNRETIADMRQDKSTIDAIRLGSKPLRDTTRTPRPRVCTSLTILRSTHLCTINTPHTCPPLCTTNTPHTCPPLYITNTPHTCHPLHTTNTPRPTIRHTIRSPCQCTLSKKDTAATVKWSLQTP